MTTSLMRRKPPAPPQPELEVTAPMSVAQAGVLGLDAIAFLAALERRFGARRRALLVARAERQRLLDSGFESLDFPTATAGVRAEAWTIAPVPADLEGRRVEMVGPADRKAIAAALQSGAQAFVADFEDSLSPTWSNLLQGQIDLFDAVRRPASANGGTRKTGNRTAALIVRPRGWHLEEAHVHLDGAPVSAALFDAGLYLFHNAHELLRRDSGAYFCLPKIESRHEAALWSEVFEEAEALLKLPVGSIRATVMIETLPAAFEMDEILYELRDYAAGLNFGRWDFLFSSIKTLGARADFILPDRAGLQASPALRAFSRLLVETCRRRGAQAIGGMSAQTPAPASAAVNEAVFLKVRAEKAREAAEGYHGTWVAHPDLVAVARAAFDDASLQWAPQRGRAPVSAADLLRAPEGRRTEEGLRDNIRVGVRYVEAWLRGQGDAALHNLIEHTATAEICRAQVWQWRRHGVQLDGGALVDGEMIIRIAREETAGCEGEEFLSARKLFLALCLNDDFKPFLTAAAYPCLLAAE